MAMEQERRKPELFDGKYELIRSIGRGRTSVVYEACRASATSADSSKLLALKILTGSGKHGASQTDRLQREALALLSCRHPNVIRLHDYVATPELCYLVMEIADRGDLRKELATLQQPFPAETALRLTQHILAGLKAIHEAGIVHGDIKPENLLLTSDGYLKIGDFTAAQLPSDESYSTPRGTGVGTFDYLAPESLDQGVSSTRSDLYAAGVVLYQMLTLKLPFSGASFAEQVKNKLAANWIGDPSELAVEAPKNLDLFMRKALAVSASERFSSAQAFSKAIDKLIEGQWTPESERRSQGMLYLSPKEPVREPQTLSTPVPATNSEPELLFTLDNEEAPEIKLTPHQAEPMSELELAEQSKTRRLIFSIVAAAMIVPTLVFVLHRNAQDKFFDEKIVETKHEAAVSTPEVKPEIETPAAQVSEPTPAPVEAPAPVVAAQPEPANVPLPIEKHPPVILKDFKMPELCVPSAAETVGKLNISSPQQAGLVKTAMSLHLDTVVIAQLIERIKGVEQHAPLWNPYTASCQPLELNEQTDQLVAVDPEGLKAVIELRQLRKDIYENKLRELLAGGAAKELNALELDNGIENKTQIYSSTDPDQLSRRVAALEVLLAN